MKKTSKKSGKKKARLRNLDYTKPLRNVEKELAAWHWTFTTDAYFGLANLIHDLYAEGLDETGNRPVLESILKDRVEALLKEGRELADKAPRLLKHLIEAPL